ncbi:MAG: hypothetical protein QMD14_00970 [Candidatus Aenigmarchaeota archaeon]|nr:hypothetical protein [Candidatus Aenigmarchaeota archaeon]
MKKSQALIIQFILFFLIGIAIFVAVGNLFRLQLDIFTSDVLTESLGLTNSYVGSIVIYSTIGCKQCDWINFTVTLPEKITHHYYKINFANKGINVSALDRPEYFFSSPHNLNYTINLSGEVFSAQPIFLTFDGTNYKLEVG